MNKELLQILANCIAPKLHTARVHKAQSFFNQDVKVPQKKNSHLRQRRERGEGGPAGGAIGWGGGILHGPAGSVCNFHRVPHRQHRPSHAQCSSAPVPLGKGVPLGL